ncbi:hypothetical protein [Streptomyces brasiliensis]|uniref:Uncharacterized protein n=1 Tax=Streptomyces brasiliensis TaxID=1954 RepID=A0A917PBF2_9ACTN|nr:hypothetical protein [Streptomyces brasiliensis]GGJ69761.1 hypothetical protein GCM10010121_095530 [Streptomyces brasiliensis]
MTITITLPRIRVPTVTERDLRRLLSLAEPAIMAIADACGAGLPVQITLRLGLKIAQQVSRSSPATPATGVVEEEFLEVADERFPHGGSSACGPSGGAAADRGGTRVDRGLG